MPFCNREAVAGQPAHVRFGSKADIREAFDQYPLYPRKRTLCKVSRRTLFRCDLRHRYPCQKPHNQARRSKTRPSKEAVMNYSYWRTDRRILQKTTAWDHVLSIVTSADVVTATAIFIVGLLASLVVFFAYPGFADNIDTLQWRVQIAIPAGD